MPKKSKQYYWYGCADCKYIAPRDEKASNENWNVYPTGQKCPICGKEIHLQFGEPPTGNNVNINSPVGGPQPTPSKR